MSKQEFHPGVKTGQYTGDGEISKAVTGIGFRPKYVRIWVHLDADSNRDLFEKSDTMSADKCAMHDIAGMPRVGVADRIISLDDDGFTVDDGGANAHPNELNQVYNYLAIG